MALYVAITGEGSVNEQRHETPWGAWGVHSSSDAVALAVDPAVLSREVEQVLVLTDLAGRSAADIVASAIGATRPEVSVRVESRAASLGVLVRAVELTASTAGSSNGTHAAIMGGLDAITHGAWLPSVARLSKPAPTMVQHVQSWVPGGPGWFAVKGDPGWVSRLPVDRIEPSQRLQVVREGAHDPDPDATVRRAAAVGTPFDCTATGELPEQAIAALFAMGLERRPTRRDALGDAERVWGTAAAIEFVISRDPGGPGTPSGTCPTCAQPVWGEFCPFCRVAPYGHTVPVKPEQGASL